MLPNMRPIDSGQFAPVSSPQRRAVGRVVAHIVDSMRPHQPQDILEVGCGTGNHVAAITAALGGVKGYGFDQSPAMLEQAADRYPWLQLREGNAEERYPFKSNRFDLVIGVDMVHYIRNLQRFFAEGLRVLRPGGTFVVATWSAEDIRRNSIAAYFPEAVEANLKQLHRLVTLEQAMREVGFIETRVTHTDYTYPFDEGEMELFRTRAYSELQLVSDACYAEGMRRLEEDYRAGRAIFRELYSYVWGRKPILE